VSSKLSILDHMHKRLVGCAEKAFKRMKPGKALSLSADDLMPMLCYIIVRSDACSMFSQADFIVHFLSEDALLGHLGFLVTSLQIALHYILDMHAHRKEGMTTDCEAIGPSEKKTQEQNSFEIPEERPSVVHEQVRGNGSRLGDDSGSQAEGRTSLATSPNSDRRYCFLNL